MTITCSRLKPVLALGLLALFSLAAVGQERPRDSSHEPRQPSAVIARDNFNSLGSRVPRLSRAELERATAKDAESEAENVTDNPLAERRAPAAAAQATVPAHRLSRDILLSPPDEERDSRTGAKDWQITLKSSFIEKFKNRATLTTRYRVIAFKAHSPREDGDAHVAGLPEDVGLACVAEIMNVKFFRGALADVKTKAQSEELVSITGAWRIWCEHPDAEPATAGPQIQDDVIPEFQTSNPNHVFELHPLNEFDGIPLAGSFEPIDGYSPKEASKAFSYYESLPCRIVPDAANQTITLFTSKAGYNYAEFVLELEEDHQFVTLDGRIVRCSALALNGEAQCTTGAWSLSRARRPSWRYATRRRGISCMC